MKYRILLNDDKESVFEELLKAALEDYPELVLEFERFQDRCKELIQKNAGRYDAVILDANGISSNNPSKEPNKEDFLDLVEIAQQKGLLTYIYSGTLNIGSSDPLDKATETVLKTKGFCRGKNLFSKTTGTDILDRIRDDLDDYNDYAKYYKGQEHLLELVYAGYIQKNEREEFLDPIMKVYSERDVVTGVGNNMRHILQSLLDVLNKKYSLFDRSESEDGNYGSIISMLGKQKVLGKQKDTDSSLIIGPMWAIHNISNARSHVSLDTQERELFFDASFSSFFLVTRWFNRILRLEINPDTFKKIIEHVVTIEDSDDNRFIYAGDFQLEIRNDWYDKLKEGVRIKISNYVKNTGPLSGKYHFFVRHNDYEIVD